MRTKPRALILFAILISTLSVFGQYTTYRLHSHNDYQRSTPFYAAADANFGSIEADIWMSDGKLLVGHDKKDLATAKTLEEQYVKPIVERYKKNKGKFYSESKHYPQLLIDLKTSYQTTLQPLIDLLKQYPEVFDATKNPLATRVVVSGATPSPDEFGQYDPIVQFDGRIKIDYTPEQLKRIGLISDAFTNYLMWRGVGTFTSEEFDMLKRWVDKVHSYGKPIRFWATPDTSIAWSELMRLGVDYINTDKIPEAAEFVKRSKK